MTGTLAVFVLVMLAMCAEFPRSNGFQWIKPTTSSSEPAPLFLRSVVYYPNNVSVTLTWKWTLVGSESFSGVVITRHKEGDKVNTETQVASALMTGDGLSETIENNYYNQTVETGQSGGITFTIKDVTKQTDNQGGGAVNVLDADYWYRCQLNAANVNPAQRTSEIKFIVNVKPKITAPPLSQHTDVSNKQVKLSCTATGKPKPVITWDIKKNGEEVHRITEEITIDPFEKKDVGVYKCSAKNDYGSDTAEAVLQYTACGSGCTTDSGIAIEMTKLNYNDGYDDKDSVNYKELMEKIERECLLQYAKQADPKIYSCVVTEFRRGSVVAMMKLTYPEGTVNPRKPLEDAINTGKFAGYDVTTSFVDPTSTATPTLTSETPSGPEPTGTPDAGQRGTTDGGGLSTGAIIAIVVVFTIIFIVIIVALVVCMLKKRKPASSNKPYNEDGAQNKTTAVPLQAQPHKEDPYDNANDKPKEVVYADLNFQDRYPNSGGPPPQYTPSSNYAEVRPNSNEQDESQVEWDKSVKDEMWI